MTFLSTITDQFSYFAAQLDEYDWSEKRVLDFGGNVGNILNDRNSNISENLYWCLDVDKGSIELGKASHPNANWVFYNRYSFFFNPFGVRKFPVPDLQQKFDFIVAYSVFTNTTQSEMLELVSQLKRMLSDNGAFVFTFIDPYHYSAQERYRKSNLQWRLELEHGRGNISVREMQILSARAHRADWFTLVNGRDLYIEADGVQDVEPEQEHSFIVFHTAEHMKKLFPGASVQPPVNKAMQHCCVIRNDSA